MLKLFHPSPRPTPIEYCERCGTVCTATCRADELREQAVIRALSLAGWI